MSEKINATFIVPDDLTGMSMHAVKLCELFVAKVLDGDEPVAEFKVDSKKMLVISNDRSIKEIISIYLKSSKLQSFYKQLTALAVNDAASGTPVLKIVLPNKMYIITLQELSALPDLHLRISRMEVANCNR